MTEPLIYTAKGNLPLKDLVRHINWQFSPDCIVVRETYTLDGEMVKESADVFKLPAGAVFNLQGNVG
jgi:hypothetical protein